MENKELLYQQCIRELSFTELCDLLFLKATLEGKDVRIKVTNPRPKKKK